MEQLYTAQTACKVAGISQRCLDYWITTKLISPHSDYKAAGRKLFLFGFRELVQLRVVSAFRRAGLSLQKIRTAIEAVRKTSGKDWQACWLVTDGKNAYVANSSTSLETISGPRSGQMAFSILALGPTQKEVQNKLTKMRVTAFGPKRARGQVMRRRRVAS